MNPTKKKGAGRIRTEPVKEFVAHASITGSFSVPSTSAIGRLRWKILPHHQEGSVHALLRSLHPTQQRKMKRARQTPGSGDWMRLHGYRMKRR